MEAAEQINVEITEYLLTPLSCSSLLNEIIKGLLFQKSQIPYPFVWLKNRINARRKQEKPLGNPHNFNVEHNFKAAAKFYDSLEDLMSVLGKELTHNSVSEFIILFGPTPLCPKEIYRINLPRLAKRHFEEAHLKEAVKLQHKVLRQVFLSNIWLSSADSTIPCTNTYFYIVKNKSDTSSQFKSCTPLKFGRNCKICNLNFKLNPRNYEMCCGDITVFNTENNETDKIREDIREDMGENEKKWYQFEPVLEGFKNVYVNKIAACDLW